MIGPLIVIFIIIAFIFVVTWYNRKEKYVSTPHYSHLNDDNDDETNHTSLQSSIVLDTVAEDVLDRIDCNRVKRIKYQSPANSECGHYSSQQYGSPALKYPVLIPI